MIEIENVKKKYGTLEVLKGISLSIQKGEVVSIVGASGAGKSTLLQIMGTLDKADSGYVKINHVTIASLNDSQLSKFRNQQIGFIFQFHHLLPEFTALENICIPAFIAGKNKKESEVKAFELLEYLNISNRAQHKPSQLSGGEQQRVAVARALINNPSVLLADEPSGNLDSVNARDLHQLFFKLREKLNQTIVLVTHNDELAGMTDRKLCMKDGILL